MSIQEIIILAKMELVKRQKPFVPGKKETYKIQLSKRKLELQTSEKQNSTLKTNVWRIYCIRTPKDKKRISLFENRITSHISFKYTQPRKLELQTSEERALGGHLSSQQT